MLEDLPQDRRTVYTYVVQLLRKLLAHENDSSSEANSKTVLLAALAKIPPEFLSAVVANEPRAIIVLAHFCIVFEKVNNDHFWYMKNWSHQIFHECCRRLEDPWKPYLAWPTSLLHSTT